MKIGPKHKLHLDILIFFFQAEDGIRDVAVTGVQTCALPICSRRPGPSRGRRRAGCADSGGPARARSRAAGGSDRAPRSRSEEHTSELQSRLHLVCRLLLEKKKKTYESTQIENTPTLHRTRVV